VQEDQPTAGATFPGNFCSLHSPRQTLMGKPTPPSKPFVRGQKFHSQRKMFDGSRGRFPPQLRIERSPRQLRPPLAVRPRRGEAVIEGGVAELRWKGVHPPFPQFLDRIHPALYSSLPLLLADASVNRSAGGFGGFTRSSERTSESSWESLPHISSVYDSVLGKSHSPPLSAR